MKSTLFNRVAIVFVALSFFISALSCVEQEYEISEENLNTEVTIFQEGVQIPIGSTAELKVKDLLEKFGEDESSEYLEYLKTFGNEGAYAISMAGNFDDMSESLSSLKGLQDEINIEGMTIHEDVAFNLSSVDVSDFKVDGQIYKMEYDLGDVVGNLNIEVPSLDPLQMEVKADLGEYVPDLSSFDFGFDEDAFPPMSVELSKISGSLPDGFASIIGEENFKAPIPVDPKTGFEYSYGGKTYLSLSPMEIEMESDPYTMEMSMDLPDGIKSIGQITLKPGAKVTVKVEVKNSLFTDGHIIPHVDFDVHEIFHLTDEENSGHDELTIDHIVDDFDLTAAGAVVTKSYAVKSIKVSEADIKDGRLVINREIKIKEASLNYQNLTTSLEKLSAAGDPMSFSMSVSFDGFELESVDLTVDTDEPVTVEENKTIPLNLDFDVPADVIENIGYVKLAKTLPQTGEKKGNIHLGLSASNVEDYMHLGLETLDITFPEELVVEGAVNGKLSYKVADLSKGLDEYINISEIRLPEPVNGKISIDRNITVAATASAYVSGSVNSAELKAAEDLVIGINVTNDLKFEDYEVVIKGFNHKVTESHVIEEKLPDAMKDLKGDITVYPEGSPEITISVVRPPMDVPVVAGEGGIVIRFPEMLKFKSEDLAAFGNIFDGNRTLTYAEGEEVPSEIVLGIDRVVVTPVTREDGIYVSGDFEVSGNIGVAEGQKVYKKDIDVLTGNDKDAKMVKIEIVVPELVPSNVAVDSYTAEIEESFEFDILSPDDLPEMIVSIGTVELDEVYIDLGVDASDVLAKLGNPELSFNMKVSIPDFIILEGVETVADKENNALIVSLSETADATGKISVDPIKVKAIDLTGVVEKKETLAGKITVSGSATLADASIDVDDLQNSEDMSISLDGGISGSGENGAITIAKASAKVDYQVDPVKTTVDLSEIREALNTENLSVNFALSHVHLGLDLQTNLGISANAEISVVPYYGDIPEEAIVRSIEINAPSAVGEVKHSKYWFAAKEDCTPEGYTYIDLPILDLLKDIPDSLQITLTAGTDKTKECVLDTHTDYILEADYSFEIPLQFDESFNIEFTHTISDIPEIIGTIFQYGSLALTGEVVSGLPLKLDMTADLLDASGNVIPLDEKAGKLLINACEAVNTPSTTEINLLFGKKKGTTIPEISDIRLTFRATAVDVPITENSFLKLTLQALVPEGITVDLKDLMSNEENEGE